ncbi:MAG: GerMN domain-containing protein [Candidatus Atribacteria bacterium]|nr:GerMN domain-containing protein [Candidatus Atribacteria bacterium]
MKKKDNSRIFAIFLLVIFIIVATIFFIHIRNNTSAETEVKAYLYDPIAKELVPLKVNTSESPELAARAIFDTLKTPSDISYFPTVPKTFNLDYAKLDKDTLSINIITNGTTLSQRNEYIAFLSIANSMKSIKGVDNLKILVNSNESKVFLRYVDIAQTLSNLTSTLPKFRETNLFFITPDMQYLALENREILDNKDPQVLAKEVLNELSYGSNIGLVSYFKSDYIKGIELKSFGNAILDFSDKINELSFGSKDATLFTLSVVNSLTEIKDIKSVSFLIEGEKVDTLFGIIDATYPIKRFFEEPSLSFMIPYFVLDVNGATAYVPTPIPTQKIDLKSLFAVLQNGVNGLKTYLSNVSLDSISQSDDTLKIVLKPAKILSAEESNYIKNQVMLTFTELSGINKIDLSIGEEGFILSR